jgi:hypothetical protein
MTSIDRNSITTPAEASASAMLNVDSPCPGLHLSQRLTTEVPPILVRKLADGEVYLLLAGTCSAERYTQDLHLCSTGTRTLRLTAYLATWSGLRSRNKTPQMASTVGSRKARRSTIVAAGRQA